MRSFLHILFIVLLGFVFPKQSAAQFIITGTVYDNTKINLVEGVKVISTSGTAALTDSMGRYSIQVKEEDSLTFIYNDKPTQKFDVGAISDPMHFNISLHIKVKGKYSTLSEVIVRTKSYREDSLENRKEYADIFNYKKPGLHTGVTPDGVVGADINELINIFRFKRNRQLKAFQKRLEFQEREKYVTYRFNKTLVARITGLKDPQLEDFLVRYRPDYEMVRDADDTIMNQYILKCFYQYKIDLLNTNTVK